MPNIKPISDLRNYTEVLKEVKINQPVYLTRNGRGAYAIVDVDELERLTADEVEVALGGSCEKDR